MRCQSLVCFSSPSSLSLFTPFSTNLKPTSTPNIILQAPPPILCLTNWLLPLPGRLFSAPACQLPAEGVLGLAPGLGRRRGCLDLKRANGESGSKDACARAQCHLGCVWGRALTSPRCSWALVEMAAAATPGGGEVALKPRTSPKSVKFLFGGLAGMGATVFVQPLDLVKNRMQLSGEGAKTREYKTSFHALTSILRAEGLRGIYTGLSAGLLRQATYTTTRLGIYTVLFEGLTGADGTPPGFLLKAVIGMTAGATGAFVGTPAEVALIRMTADGRLPLDQRRGYKNVFNALLRIVKEEGVLTLWRGCIPTMARAVVVNAAQLASYSQSKQFLLDSGHFSDNIFCHFCASMISGLVTTAASMPVDIVKTRIQNMRTIDGKPEYKNGLDVLVKVIRYEGFFSLWKGFTPYYARLGPHTVLTFIFLEQMNKAYKKFFLSG